MSVSLCDLSVACVNAWCSQMSKEGFKLPRTGDRGGCDLLCGAGTELRAACKSVVTAVKPPPSLLGFYFLRDGISQ